MTARPSFATTARVLSALLAWSLVACGGDDAADTAGAVEDAASVEAGRSDGRSDGPQGDAATREAGQEASLDAVAADGSQDRAAFGEGGADASVEGGADASLDTGQVDAQNDTGSNDGTATLDTGDSAAESDGAGTTETGGAGGASDAGDSGEEGGTGGTAGAAASDGAPDDALGNVDAAGETGGANGDAGGAGGAGGAAGSGGTGGTGAAGADASVDGPNGADGSTADASSEEQQDAEASAPPSPSICPEVTALVEGESLMFTSQFGPVNWSVAADDAATPGTVTAGGVYTAPATPGTFHVVATSQADAQRSAVATVTVVPASALPTLSGTITDTVGGQGRIYVMASGAGTVSLAAPGAYAIRGVSEGPGQSVTLIAYRDVLGVGTYVEAVDPYASTMVTWNGSSISGIDLALGAPPALPAQVAPDKVQVFTMDHGALVVWNHNGQETVDHYRVYASANANPLADAQAVVRTVRAGTSPVAIVDPLVNGVTYFALATVRQTIEGPATIVGPFTVGPPAAQWAVSGTVDFGGTPPPGGALYVLVHSPTVAWGASVGSPAAQQPFVIPGVTDNSYEFVGVFDRQMDGEIGPGDLATFRGEEDAPRVQVAGADLHLPTSFMPITTTARVGTNHVIDDFGERYSLNMSVDPGLRVAVGARLVGGPGVVGPVDIALGDIGEYGWRVDLASGPPAPGDTYVFNVTYDDGSTCDVSAGVTGVLGAVPAPLAPLGTSSVLPTFTWSAPVPPPAGSFEYTIWVGAQQGMSSVDVWHGRIPSTLPLSVTFNDDGTATQATLTPGATYYWTVQATDADGNSATGGATFTVSGASDAGAD